MLITNHGLKQYENLTGKSSKNSNTKKAHVFKHGQMGEAGLEPATFRM
jgi:hypothetical protein